MIQMKYSVNFFLSLITVIVLLPSCANIIPPGGGPRDSLPPRLVMALPKDSATNLSITTKNVLLTFDEYVTMQNIQENLVVSPTLKNTPSVDSKLRNITVRFRDTLDPNTTYTLDFGDAIKDVNEGNIAKNFSYVFSTGSTIDHYTYRGKVLLAENGKTDSTLIVVLHRNLADTAVAKERIRYYARITGKGDFIFRNLPAGNFAAYVLPNDYTKKYDDSTKLFAFLNTSVTVGSNTRMDTFYAFQEAKRKERARTATTAKPVNNVNKTKEDNHLKFLSSLENGQQDLLSDLQLAFNRKFATVDTTKILLCDTNYHALAGYTVSLDTSKTKISIHYNWKENLPFRVMIAKEAVADSTGNTLAKADTLRFYTEKESNYGSIHLQFNNLDLSRNPVLQFIQNDHLTESVPLTGPELKRRLYRPGSYELRVLYDTNKNGVWDTGKFFGEKRQPEVVQFIPVPLSVRGNWDNQVAINL